MFCIVSLVVLDLVELIVIDLSLLFVGFTYVF